MNKVQKRFLAFLAKVEAAYQQPLVDAIQGQLNWAATRIEKGEPWQDLPKKGVTATLRALHESAGLPMAMQERAVLKRKIGRKAFDTPEDKMRWMVNEYYRRNLLNSAVTPITETTRKQIEQIMQQGNNEGWGAKKIAAAIRKTTDLTKTRAALIARTESTKAANAGKMMAAAELDINVVKEWVSANDIRTRRIPRDQYDHLHMDGKQVPYGGFFVVPSTKSLDAMQFPGDPNGSAGNVCNCRCTVVFQPVQNGMGDYVPLSQSIQGGAGSMFVEIAREALGLAITGGLVQDLIASIINE